MTDFPTMGQLTSKEAQQNNTQRVAPIAERYIFKPIVLPQQCKPSLPEKATGVTFSIPLNEPKTSLLTFTRQTKDAPAPPTFTRQTKDAPAPPTFTQQTTKAPTSLTEAQQLKFA